jgi:lipopolysaccharide/colanic/teichoic acid biosynthesis glycosyltransferase
MRGIRKPKGSAMTSATHIPHSAFCNPAGRHPTVYIPHSTFSMIRRLLDIFISLVGLALLALPVAVCAMTSSGSST